MKRGLRKVRVGTVISDKMDKTIVVRIDRTLRHALYGRTIEQFTKLYAHDEQNKAGVGDSVKIMETRPLSALKRWRLVEVLAKAK